MVLLDRGRKTHFGCRLLPGGGGGWGGVLGDGLRFKVIAPNVDTSSICCPGFLFSSSAVAGNNYRLRMKPKQKLRPSV